MRISGGGGITCTDPAGSLKETFHKRQHDQTYKVEITKIFYIIGVKETFIRNAVIHYGFDYFEPVEFYKNENNKYSHHREKGDRRRPQNDPPGAFLRQTVSQYTAERLPTVEQFLINRYTDMPENDEGGLHLGLRYEEGYADAEHLFIHPGPYKKISYVIRDLGTEAEERWVREARDYVGRELYDSLLTPVLPEADPYFDEIAASMERECSKPTE